MWVWVPGPGCIAWNPVPMIPLRVRAVQVNRNRALPCAVWARERKRRVFMRHAIALVTLPQYVNEDPVIAQHAAQETDRLFTCFTAVVQQPVPLLAHRLGIFARTCAHDAQLAASQSFRWCCARSSKPTTVGANTTDVRSLEMRRGW
jgi:hypothetical protein